MQPRHTALIRKLHCTTLAAPARAHVQDKYTPLNIAADSGHADAAAVLLAGGASVAAAAEVRAPARACVRAAGACARVAADTPTHA